MADFDPFSNPESDLKTEEIDPVADFIAREQKQLSEIDDFEVLASDNTKAEEALSNSTSNSAVVDPFFQDAATEDNFGTTINQQHDINYDGMGMKDEDISSEDDRYKALKEDGPPRFVTDKIREWQEEQAKRLVLKDAESEKKQKEWLSQARQELEDYYKHRDDQMNKSKTMNRRSEDAFVQERDEKKPGAEWERVCRLCDFNPKSATRTTKDISRFRSLLLQLKQTPNAS